MTQPAPAAPARFPVTTALELHGMTVERDLGLAFGLVVRSMGAIKTMGAGLKAMRRGEVTQYTELLEDSRRHAIDRMIEKARAARRDRSRRDAVRLLRHRPAAHRGGGLRDRGHHPSSWLAVPAPRPLALPRGPRP